MRCTRSESGVITGTPENGPGLTAQNRQGVESYWKIPAPAKVPRLAAPPNPLRFHRLHIVAQFRPPPPAAARRSALPWWRKITARPLEITATTVEKRASLAFLSRRQRLFDPGVQIGVRRNREFDPGQPARQGFLRPSSPTSRNRSGSSSRTRHSGIGSSTKPNNALWKYSMGWSPSADADKTPAPPSVPQSAPDRAGQAPAAPKSPTPPQS